MFNRSKIITNFSIALTGVVVATGVGFFYLKNSISTTHDGNLSAGISLSSSHESVLTIMDKGKGAQILKSPSTTPITAIFSDPITSLISSAPQVVPPINLVTPISSALKTTVAPSDVTIPHSALLTHTSTPINVASPIISTAHTSVTPSTVTNLNSLSTHTSTPINVVATPIVSPLQTAATQSIATTHTTIPSASTMPIGTTTLNSSSTHTSTTPSDGYKSDITQQLETFINDDSVDAETKLTAEIVKSLQKHNQSTDITPNIQSKINAAKTIKELKKENEAIVNEIKTLTQSQTAAEGALLTLTTDSNKQQTALDQLNTLSSTNTASINRYVSIDLPSKLTKAKQELNQTTTKITESTGKINNLDNQIKTETAVQAQLVIDIKSQKQEIQLNEDLLYQNSWSQAALMLSSITNRSLNTTQQTLTNKMNDLLKAQIKHKDLLKQQKLQKTTLETSVKNNEKQKITFAKELSKLNTKSQKETKKLQIFEKQQTAYDSLLKQQQDYDAQITTAKQNHAAAEQKLLDQQAAIAQIQTNIFDKTTKQTTLKTQEPLLRQSLSFTS